MLCRTSIERFIPTNTSNLNIPPDPVYQQVNGIIKSGIFNNNNDEAANDELFELLATGMEQNFEFQNEAFELSLINRLNIISEQFDHYLDLPNIEFDELLDHEALFNPLFPIGQGNTNDSADSNDQDETSDFSQFLFRF